MKKNLVEVRDDLQNILYTFAEFYKHPNEQFIDEISSGTIDEEFTSLFSKLDVPIKSEFKGEAKKAEDLKQQYLHCFSGISHPFAPAVESLYKPWTTDQTAKVSIAKNKGYLMGDAALHMQHLLKQYNIVVPNGYDNMPDHLTLQLEFLAYLHEGDNTSIIQQFVADHLDWLDDFIEELKKVEKSSFYVYVTSTLNQFLKTYY